MKEEVVKSGWDEKGRSGRRVGEMMEKEVGGGWVGR